MTTEALYGAYLAELEASYAGLRVILKSESRFCRLLDRLVRILTFGGQDRFMSQYVTTLGRRIYVPDDWLESPAAYRYCVMRHEAVHVRQFQRYRWPAMIVLYCLLPLPTAFSGRAWIELPAYRETLTATWQIYGERAAREPELLDRIVRRFTGPDYGWMWLRGGAIRRALERHLDALTLTPPPRVEL